MEKWFALVVIVFLETVSIVTVIGLFSVVYCRFFDDRRTAFHLFFALSIATIVVVVKINLWRKP
jgi:hypothetical protein